MTAPDPNQTTKDDDAEFRRYWLESRAEYLAETEGKCLRTVSRSGTFRFCYLESGHEGECQ